MADLAEVTQILAQADAWLPARRVRFDFGEGGAITLDGVACVVSNDRGAADAVVHLGFADFKRLAKGTLNPVTALMLGRLRIEGDLAVAMELRAVTRALGETRN